MRKQTVAPRQLDKRVYQAELHEAISRGKRAIWKNGYSNFPHEHDGIKDSFWSYHYPWLPYEVEFTVESGTEVKVASHIHGLLPAHVGIYRGLEELLSPAIELWAGCCFK